MSNINLGAAVLVAIGGTMGFLKTGSATSLATAIVFAVLVAFSALRLKQRDQKALLLLKVLWLLLAVVMGYRFSQSFKIMPAGVVFALSVVMFAYNSLYKQKK
eukprot:TRINITY_DN15549_c0_g1_i1.p1 TRINITY_DN15549_c0_g1~~TRINITY_DN15549_c0_g1_i1.p1  ORF type:complete len:103 (-),score=6.70 TRINITY_DN15549_c0_g1_i1:28-336(-)